MLEGSTIQITGTIANAVGSSVASAIPVVGTIASLITNVIGAITAHHAAAVADQDAILCNAVPGVNSILTNIDAGIAAQTLSPAQAQAQYGSLLTQFHAAVTADPSYKAGDALNGYLIALQCVIAARTSDLQAIRVAPVAPATIESEVAGATAALQAATPAVQAAVAQLASVSSATLTVGSFQVPWWILIVLAALVFGRFIFDE